MRIQMLNNPITEETAGKTGITMLRKKGIVTEEREEITNEIRKNKENSVLLKVSSIERMYLWSSFTLTDCTSGTTVQMLLQIQRLCYIVCTFR